MRKYIFSAVLILMALIFLNGCKKDNLTEMLSGTYIVSGNDPNNSLAPAINNAAIEVSKEDKERLNVSFNSLPRGRNLTVEYDGTVSGNEVYYYRGNVLDSSEIWTFDIAFYKSNADSVYVRYFYQDTIPATEVYSYILRGKKN